MGSSYPHYSRAWHDEQREIKQAAKQQEERLMELARKIVMIVVDEVNRVVVRPGPVAEERECYDMALEIIDIKPKLENLVRDILKVDEDEN